MENKNYYLGLDIGTDSVGYAVTDEHYHLLKHNGEPMWGSHLFEAGKLNQERRAFRTARRRLNRRQQRVLLIQELFAEEINKVDPLFYQRIRESALLREDAHEPNCLFNDPDYRDADYHKQYPTIHHLIVDLMKNSNPHDIRLVYIACAWLVAHRGHFLSEVDKTHVSEVTDFNVVYDAFLSFFEQNGYDYPWTIDVDRNELAVVLKRKSGVKAKSTALKTLLYPNSKPAKAPENPEDSTFPYSQEAIIQLLSGGKVKMQDLYGNEDYQEIKSVSLASENDFQEAIAALGDDAELLIKLRSLFDWALLEDSLHGHQYISEAKINIYTQHQQDLKTLKKLIKKYGTAKQYNDMFRSTTVAGNYVSYSGHTKEVTKKVKKDDFYKYVKDTLKTYVPKNDKDEQVLTDIKNRIETQTYMPKQVDGDNRVIPYQLYWAELNELLHTASAYLPFLTQKGSDGLTVIDKVLSVFTFRVPYYVGPLNTYHKDITGHAWIVKKSEGRIVPWNFTEMVDEDASEEAFIKRMTNTCTYIPGEEVLPKASLLYQRFMVLNEINNIKINGIKLDPTVKQNLYTDLFETQKRVTPKNIRDWLVCNNVCSSDDAANMSGLDQTVKASLSSYISFKKYIQDRVLSEEEVESIIARSAYSDEKRRFRSWLKSNMPQLTPDDVKYISSLNLKDFGRLSAYFLTELIGGDQDTGEGFSIIDALWETNNNLMELLSERFTFTSAIRELVKDYYSEHPHSLEDRLDEMYISNAVKRPIYRTLDVIHDITKATKCAPSKIFIEMARGADPDQKGRRTVSRKDQLLALYKQIANDDSRRLSKELTEITGIENRLQSDKLFLYYMQLGRCMYTGKPIDISKLSDGTYNIEHIYPQSLVKDDSLTNNEVLVLSEINGQKSDTYPINAEIRHSMKPFWTFLHENGLISDEKYRRLTRSTPFTADEKWGFINRQLVETRQSTKAIATLLQEKFPNAEIVYVKAGLVSDFRHFTHQEKSRIINDLHHAKDAYLNIVVGNVYHEKFNKRWFNIQEEYSIKTKTIFTHSLKRENRLIWNYPDDLEYVKATMNKNTPHLTVFAYQKGGGFYDQTIYPASDGLLPKKKSLPTEKYGGYNKASVSFYYLVQYSTSKQSNIMFVPVELVSWKQIKDLDGIISYVKTKIEQIVGQLVVSVSFPLGLKKLRINTVIQLDNMRVTLSGKSGGGKQLIISLLTPLKLTHEYESYIKRLESFTAKKQNNKSLVPDEPHDHISPESNLILFNCLVKRLSSSAYKKRPGVPTSLSSPQCRQLFQDLSISDQVTCLLNILSLFSRSSSGTDLHYLKEAPHAGVTLLNANIALWKKQFSDVRIIDVSASGLYETKSPNLLDLL